MGSGKGISRRARVVASRRRFVASGKLVVFDGKEIRLGGQDFREFLAIAGVLDKRVKVEVCIFTEREFYRDIFLSGKLKISGTGYVCVDDTVLVDRLDVFLGRDVEVSVTLV